MLLLRNKKLNSFTFHKLFKYRVMREKIKFYNKKFIKLTKKVF